MLRRTLIAAAGSERLRSLASSAAPARAVARRFVAGEELDDALDVIRRLNATGRRVTLDYLGEAVSDAAIARRAADVYDRALEAIAADDLDASVSVKPTQLGLDVDPDLCHDLIAGIAEQAAATGTHVTVDMEGSEHTQATFDLVEKLRADGQDNVGCAVQAYLHRTPDDVRHLTQQGVSLRLCKGAYAEPAEIAWQDRDRIRTAYLESVGIVFASRTYGRFATHDDWLISRIRNRARRALVGRERFEFQMLYGVREPLQDELVRAGYDVRVYVPFGDQWYPYLVRRLAERPANLLFFLRALAGRRVTGDDDTDPGGGSPTNDRGA